MFIFFDIFLVSSLLLIAGLTAYFILSIIDNVSNSTADDKIALLIVTFVGALIAFFTIVITIVGLFVRKKLEKLEFIEEKVKDLNKTLIISAEMAASQLPPLLVTQHIPSSIMDVVSTIKNIFDNPDVERVIKELGKEARLIYIIAAYYFVKHNYKDCASCLEKIVDALPDVPEDLRRDSLSRLGIVYRNMGRYEDSVKCFERMERT